MSQPATRSCWEKQPEHQISATCRIEVEPWWQLFRVYRCPAERCYWQSYEPNHYSLSFLSASGQNGFHTSSEKAQLDSLWLFIVFWADRTDLKGRGSLAKRKFLLYSSINWQSSSPDFLGIFLSVRIWPLWRSFGPHNFRTYRSQFRECSAIIP